MTSTVFQPPYRQIVFAIVLIAGVCANHVQAQIGHVHIGPTGGGGFAGAGAVGGLGSSYDSFMPLPLSPLPDLNLGGSLAIPVLPQPVSDLSFSAPALIDVLPICATPMVNSGYGNSSFNSWAPVLSCVATGSPPPPVVEWTFVPPAPVASNDDDQHRAIAVVPPPTAGRDATPTQSKSSGGSWKFWLIVVAVFVTVGSLFDR